MNTSKKLKYTNLNCFSFLYFSVWFWWNYEELQIIFIINLPIKIRLYFPYFLLCYLFLPQEKKKRVSCIHQHENLFVTSCTAGSRETVKLPRPADSRLSVLQLKNINMSFRLPYYVQCFQVTSFKTTIYMERKYEIKSSPKALLWRYFIMLSCARVIKKVDFNK